MPLISIVTPVHNGRDFIEECIRSVKAQTLGDYEHLIIDNMSTDDSVGLAKAIAANDPRIKVLANNAEKGAAATRNVGIQAAEGKYIAFLDSDDAWKPEKLAVQIKAMQDQNLAFSWSSYDVVDAGGKFIREQTTKTGTSHSLLMKKIVIGCLTSVYDQEKLGKLIMNYHDMPEDFCFWMDVLRASEAEGLPCGAIQQSLARYRVHQNGVSAGKVKAAKAHWCALRNHLALTYPRAAIAFLSYVKNGLLDRS